CPRTSSAGCWPTGSCWPHGPSGAAGSCTSRSPTRPAAACPATASTPSRSSGWRPRSTPDSPPRAGSRRGWGVKAHHPRSLAASRVADVLVVNPIRDGMNLVAEEGPVLSDRGCALVLSREAGAASLLGSDALLVNPYDVSATASALHQALTMPEDN